MVTAAGSISLVWLMAVLFVMQPSSAIIIGYQTLHQNEFSTHQLSPTGVIGFQYTTSNYKANCTNLYCTVGDRWLKFSAHHQKHPLTITASLYSPPFTNFTPPPTVYTAIGSNIGITLRYGSYSNVPEEGCYESDSVWSPGPAPETFYVLVSFTHPEEVEPNPPPIAVHIESADVFKPVPGGCNAEGQTPDDPTLVLNFDKLSTTLSFGQGDYGVPRLHTGSQHFCSCDAVSLDTAQPGGSLTYEVYLAFINDCGSVLHHDFAESAVYNNLRLMSTVDGVKKYGVKQNKKLVPNLPRVLTLDSVPGQAIVYNILVTDVFHASLNPHDPIERYQSVYTPRHTYACHFSPEDKRSNPKGSSCRSHLPADLITISVILLLLGNWLGLFGLRYFAINLFIVSTLISLFGYYTAISVTAPKFSTLAALALGLLAALPTGLLAFGLWRKFDATGGALVMYGIMLGFLMTAFFFATPLGDFKIFTNPFNYGMGFTCGTLAWPVLLLLKGKLLCVLSTSVAGAYMVLYSIDAYIGSDFDNIYSNVMDRIFDKQFAASYSGNFFGHDFNGCTNLAKNVGFLVGWFGLAFVYAVLQYWCIAQGLNLPETKDSIFSPAKPNRSQEYIVNSDIKTRHSTSIAQLSSWYNRRRDSSEEGRPLLEADLLIARTTEGNRSNRGPKHSVNASEYVEENDEDARDIYGDPLGVARSPQTAPPPPPTMQSTNGYQNGSMMVRQLPQQQSRPQQPQSRQTRLQQQRLNVKAARLFEDE